MCRLLPAASLALGVIVGLTLLGGGGVWLVLVVDGLPAVGVVLAAAGWGAWPVKWLGLGTRPREQQICAAAALGLGVLAGLMLGLGVAGWMNRIVAWVVVGVGWGLGLIRVGRGRASGGRFTPTAGTEPGRYISRRERIGGNKGGAAPTADSGVGRYISAGGAPAATGERPSGNTADGDVGRYKSATGVGWYVVAGAVLLTLVVPLAVMLFGASLPPGVLWSEENRAYDVLEYHLQGPREYFDAGRITFLPHNVYTSFPQQMEMLYLLLMHLVGSPLGAALAAQYLHALVGVLAVVALGAWSPPGWPRLVAVVAGGTVPWLAYLGCLAYVELGVVFFAAVAGGIVLDQLRGEAAGRAALAAGLCAGLAGGCKYTALVFVVVALAAAWAVCSSAPLRRRVRHVGMFAMGVVLAFSPWLVRNAALAGNPVYPFAYRWFGGAAWSAEQDAQWARGHELSDGKTAADRVRAVWDELVSPKAGKFGPLLFLLAAAGLIIGRSRGAALLGVWAVLLVAGWMLLTHMPGRFAVPIVVPLALLAGHGAEPRGWRGRRAIVASLVCAAVVGGVLNGVTLVRLLRADDGFWQRFGWPLRELVGQVDLLAENQPINQLVPGDARVWLVGEARVFYVRPAVHYVVAFSRDPWLTYAAEVEPAAAVAWLRTQNISHVVFSWDEIGRLQRTYGFPAFVTPAWATELAGAGLRQEDLPAEARSLGLAVYAVVPE